jgi:hypothetical protein
LRFIEVLPDILRGDPGEIKPTPFAPGKELLYGVKISTAGVCVANLAVEEFFSGEDCCLGLLVGWSDRRKQTRTNRTFEKGFLFLTAGPLIL